MVNLRHASCFFTEGLKFLGSHVNKHTVIDIPTNHYEIIALYEATHEYALLHRVINHIQVSCGIEPIGSPTIIYEDN
jgi:hypothetical protein